MTDNDISKLLPDWTMSYVISQSGNEKIYRAERETASGTQYSIVRAVFIPCFDEKFEALKKEKSEEELIKLNNKMLADCKKETLFLRGVCSKGGWLNIRESYDISNSNSTQTLFVSRFDSAQLLDDFIKENGLTQGALLKLGIDLCYSVEIIGRLNNTIHGSLRPDIVFVDDSCKFRVGKIDVNTEQNKTRESLGDDALLFAAPETDGETLDGQSDVYSIGLILYYYLNDRRLPFEDKMVREEALKKRLSGAQIPLPAHDIGEITKIVMKACSTDKKVRYANSISFRKDMEEAYFRLQKEIEEAEIKERARIKKIEDQNKKPEELEKEKDISAKREVEKDEEDLKKEEASANKKKRLRLFAVAAAVIAIVCATGFTLLKNMHSKDIGKYRINLASVYYKDTDRAEEFKFNYNYDGEAKEPAVVIGDLEGLVEGKDYEVEYSNNVEIGEATITVSGIGDYKGSKSRTFYIKPQKPGDIEDAVVEEVGSDYAVLTWNESERAEKYLIYKYDFETREWGDVEYELDASQTSIKMTNLKADTLYKFSIKGVVVYDGGKFEPGVAKSIEVKTKS